MIASSDSKLRTLASYAAWTLGGHVAVMLFQFVYAAVTSRLVPDTGFGAVTVAMGLQALVTLFAQGGLGEAAARTPELHPGKLSFLVMFAIGLGIVSGLLLVLLAGPWAVLWNAPDAVGPARFVAVTVAVAPLSGLLLGVLRRLGEFRVLAISMVATSAAGMAIGVVAVILAPGPMTLLISPVLATLLLAVVLLVLTRRHWRARPDAAAAQADLGFAWRVLGLTMLAYLGPNLGRWSVSRWIGVDALGQWNRADVLTAVPIEQGVGALTRAVYPEIRHDIGVQSRTRQAWTDYLLLVAWACFPVAAILAGAAPIATAVLFGPGWGLAAAIAPLVAIQSGIASVEAALASSLASVGRFRLLVPTAFASVAVMAAGAVMMKVTGLWAVALVALIAASLLRHLLQVGFTVRYGALDGRRLVKGYSGSLATSAVLGGAAGLVSAAMLGGIRPIAGIGGAVVLIASAVAGIVMRRHLPPVRILARYRSNGSATS
jgi:O-antigen/teichoic acid export membrane protein